MSEREPITAELRAALDVDREFMRADGTVVAQTFCVDRDDFDRCCDAIDAVHAALERENAELRERVAVLDNERGNMHETDAWKLGYDEGFANADDWLAQHEDAMAEHGWVRLPLDADGEVWHVGDFVVGEINPRNPKAIERMLWYGPDSGWQLETDTIIYPCPDRPHHHHAPTVEDVLREMADRCYADEDEPRDRDAIVAEYAAKLRLAGDAS